MFSLRKTDFFYKEEYRLALQILINICGKESGHTLYRTVIRTYAASSALPLSSDSRYLLTTIFLSIFQWVNHAD